jgi:polyferredoxin
MKRPSTARISQYLFLLSFVALFLMTEYRGSDRLGVAVNGFFRANPLTAVTTMLATRSYVPLLLPGLLLLVCSVLLGRFFCGWVCPLGTVLDLVTGKIRKSAPLRYLEGSVKYWLLLPLLVSALLNVNLAGLLDPIAILLRGLTFFVHPLIGASFRDIWRGLYRVMGDHRDALAPGYRLIHDYLLPFRETVYPLAFLSALLLALIIFLERYEERTWCRHLCPLGTLLGLAARFSPLVRKPEKLCDDCRACTTLCPTAFDRELLQKEACLLCMSCVDRCPHARARFSFGRKCEEVPLLMGRRVVIGSLFSGFFLARLFRYQDPSVRERFLRPPGVNNESEFLGKCVRCGECMKVCLRSALYPSLLGHGVEALYTPVLIPRLGYCEFNCTLCGQVCPTGAIPDLVPAEKKRQVIGKAVFDRNHCLPFARRIDCIVCEEHCPIPQKAIRSEVVTLKGYDGGDRTVKLPYVVDDLCNGCGICENVCPLEGKSGVEVFAVKDHTPLKEHLDAPAPPSGNPYG